LHRRVQVNLAFGCGIQLSHMPASLRGAGKCFESVKENLFPRELKK